ncbi:MAG: DNA cytosine methyltransferase [Spirochaetes bacterium]|nr:MAG: DNA cytosine methyltransferase [Spirochaetota bacterium]
MRKKLKVLDLFSGIGGFSLGLERTGGFETVAFCEIDPFCQRVLRKHWKGIPIYEDITSFEYHGPVDLVTGGFPCQDASIANRRASGIAGERTGLFWYIIRTVCMVGRPRVLLENVAELLNRGMGTVLGALAAIGYDAQWHCIPASAVGAPQERDRVWIIADPCENRKVGLVTIQDIGRFRQGWDGRQEDLQSIADNPFQPGKGWPQPLIRGVDDKPPHWAHRVGACGNAVVPQIPEMIGLAILDAEDAA